jgi:broad specificity phosphatase PhoE
MRPVLTGNASLLLVRHGACEQMESLLLGRALDPPLNSAGERQAAALARFLRPEREMVICASPRLRTRQTADAIGKTANAAVVLAECLDEMDFGSWGGCSFAELAGKPDWAFWNQHRSCARTPAGDTMLRAQKRVVTYVEELSGRHHPQRLIVLVTHAEIIRAALLHFLRFDLDEYRHLTINPGSISRLALKPEGHPSILIGEDLLASTENA